MKSRYDYMRESPVKDIDGENFPDPLTVDYQAVVDQTLSLPATMTLSRVYLKRFWKILIFLMYLMTMSNYMMRVSLFI